VHSVLIINDVSQTESWRYSNGVQEISGTSFRVKCASCHRNLAHPQVADRGESFQIWRVAVNVMNMQSRRADSGWYYNLRVGWTPHIQSPQEPSMLCNVTPGCRLGACGPNSSG
jgi:hypothetical protein